jgi:hypothetical protein
MAARFFALALFTSLCATFQGCSSSSDVDVVDLNRVLDLLAETLDEQAAKAAPPAAAEVSSDAEIAAGTIKPVDPTQTNPAIESEFLVAYAAKLNAANLITSPIGVEMSSTGEIVGFKDANSDAVQTPDESQLFTVTIDLEQNRLIASDGDGNYRPHSYRPGGFFTGYLLGSMLGRQNNYYSGAMAGNRPSFRGTTMSPPDYHANAVNTARSRVSTSSARVRTGSGGFSFGK